MKLEPGSESPQHEVTIPKPFAIGRCAVTRGQFAAFVAATGHKMDGGADVWNGKEWKNDPSKSWRDPGFAQEDSHPAVCVNWEDAKAYVAWLAQASAAHYRLLSEAEWEYACRAGSVTPFWWGPAITPDQANYDGNHTYEGGGRKGEYRQRTVPARHFEANPWGLYQVHGNVWEWCEDTWHDSYSDKPESLKASGAAWTTGDSDSRVLRGGSWYINPRSLRSAGRIRLTAVIRYSICRFPCGQDDYPLNPYLLQATPVASYANESHPAEGGPRRPPSSSRPSGARAGIVSNSGRCVLRSRVCSAPLRAAPRTG